MTVMVTNDDGLTDGLRVLSEVAAKLDPDSYTITPHQQKSAVAKGITLHRIIRLKRAEEEALPIYRLNGTPADCMAFALFSGDFRKPDLVLSGINTGDNLSLHSIYSSGTIGACLEASLYGIPAIAFSLEMHREQWEKYQHAVWPEREALKAKVLEIVKRFRGKIPKHTVLNVNLPENFENASIIFPRPALMRYESKMEKRFDPNNQPYYWHYGTNKQCEEGSDVCEFYMNHSITITPLSILNIVDDAVIKKIKG